MKKTFIYIVLVLSTLLALCTIANAKETDMYVNGISVKRNLETVGNFDMIPILDIAGELGYSCDFDGYNIRLYNTNQSFSFTMGNASVYDKNGKWFGLDVVPQYMNGRVMIPANFLVNVLNMPYTWDYVTKTIFINSENVYNWLIDTYEYQDAKEKIDLINIAKDELGIIGEYKIGTHYYWTHGNKFISPVGVYSDTDWLGYVLVDTNSYNILCTMNFANTYGEGAGDLGEYYEVYKAHLYDLVSK